MLTCCNGVYWMWRLCGLHGDSSAYRGRTAGTVFPQGKNCGAFVVCIMAMLLASLDMQIRGVCVCVCQKQNVFVTDMEGTEARKATVVVPSMLECRYRTVAGLVRRLPNINGRLFPQRWARQSRKAVLMRILLSWLSDFLFGINPGHSRWCVPLGIISLRQEAKDLLIVTRATGCLRSRNRSLRWSAPWQLPNRPPSTKLPRSVAHRPTTLASRTTTAAFLNRTSRARTCQSVPSCSHPLSTSPDSL